MELFNEVEMPNEVLEKLNINDVYRMKLHLTNCLAVKYSGLKWSDVFHNSHVFWNEEQNLSGDKYKVLQIFLMSTNKY
jgi:hypothetical protein